jgi:hypothetical protein
MDAIEKLERHRIANHLKKTDMARMLGANTRQQYSAWVARGSLPKRFYQQAAEILGESIVGVEPRPGSADYDSSLFSQLSEEQKMGVVLSLIDSLGDRERAAILAKIVTGK